MTDNPTPAQSDEEQLVHVGWWCWRGNGHGHLATMACKSDNVPLHVPAEWADEMRAVIQRIEDGDDEDESPAPRPTAAPTIWVDGHPQLEAIAFAVWEKCERSDSGLTIDDPRNIAVAALSAVQPLPTAPAGVGVSATPSHTDQATVLLSEAERLMLRHALDLADANISARPDEYTAADEAALASLRRLADEAQQQEPESGCAHCGGDHSWDACQAYTAVVADAPESEPSVHGESVAHLAGLHGRRDQWAGDEQADFVPPVAEGLPSGALDSARNGATMLDAWAEDPHGRNFLAHALVQLARDGWLRTEPADGFEPVRERDDVPEPQDPATLAAVDARQDGAPS